MQEPPKTSSKTKTRRGTGLARATSVTLLGVGAAVLIASFIYVSQILAFIGLSLMFWGALLLYIQPGEYTRKALLDATALTSLEALSQIMQELNYKGKAIYLPPKYCSASLLLFFKGKLLSIRLRPNSLGIYFLGYTYPLHQ